MSNDEGPGRDVTDVLGYLLKHAHLQLTGLTTRALEPFGIDSRALGVLRVLASRRSTSQQQVAELLGVDRTTMVALLDSLEEKGIVSRRPDADDRRRNVVALTEEGQGFFARATAAERDAEDAYVAGLSKQDQQHLRRSLRVIVVRSSPARSDAE